MTPKVRICTAFDLIGAGALVGAVVALISRFSVSSFPETTIFSTFFTCLAVAVGAFLVARILQMAEIVIRHPNPRSRRVYQATATNLASVAVASVETQATDLRRAA